MFLILNNYHGEKIKILPDIQTCYNILTTILQPHKCLKQASLNKFNIFLLSSSVTNVYKDSLSSLGGFQINTRTNQSQILLSKCELFHFDCIFWKTCGKVQADIYKQASSLTIYFKYI